MEYKVVVSDPKNGKSYQLDVKDEQAKKIKGRKIGEAVDGSAVGLPGYKLEVTGGSDKGGFPMKAGVHLAGAVKILMGNGVGYHAEKGHRARRRVHGEEIGDNIIQVNTKVVEYGGKSLDELLGKAVEAKDSDKKGE
ncbi:MAG: 30S ribosomal protein S6e [Candidatus Altiarchaeota archaeon]